MNRVELFKEKALGFDDILLLPAEKSKISSRKEVDTTTKLSKNITLKYPIISAPMDTISDVDTCIALNKIGAAGILHRFMSIDEQVEKSKKIKQDSGKCYVAVGLKDYEERIIKLLSSVAIDLFVLDTANVNTPLVEKFFYWYGINKRKRIMPDLMVGNTLTQKSVERAFDFGADSIKHSIGNGGVCTTTDMTGIGCPPITALYYGWLGMENYPEKSLILDGGIKKPSDLCVTGNTRILAANLKWIQAKNIKIGDLLIGFDENTISKTENSKQVRRKYKTTKVIKNDINILDCVEIITDKGSIKVSKDHKWLVKTPHGNEFEWIKSIDLKNTHQIVYFGEPWEEGLSKDDGYISGFLDGEGCISKQKSGCILNIVQAKGTTADYFYD